MNNKLTFFFLISLATFFGSSCKKSNGNPPLIINNGREEILYSRDTTDFKSYQLHLTYNTNGSVDILRNEVGAVHASSANEFIETGIQTMVTTTSVKAVLVAGQQYWLVPFQPGAAVVPFSSADTLLYTCNCSSASGGPAQLVTLVNPSQPLLITTNPHGCASNSVTIASHNNTYSYIGGATLLQASSVNIKK